MGHRVSRGEPSLVKPLAIPQSLPEAFDSPTVEWETLTSEGGCFPPFAGWVLPPRLRVRNLRASELERVGGPRMGSVLWQ